MSEIDGNSGSGAPRTGDPLAAALARLLSALAALEAACGRRSENDLARSDIAETLGAMQDDRTRLALELDAALARGQRLEAANDEVAKRLEAAAVALAGLARNVEGAD
ncbi:MAG: DUF4164 family protein [Rhodoblastus sp.]